MKQDRDQQVQAVMCRLEHNMELLGLTGVEDKLQDGVRQCLETLRNAGLKVSQFHHHFFLKARPRHCLLFVG